MVSVISLSIVSLALAAGAPATAAQAKRSTPAEAAARVVRVASSTVCMVNDRDMRMPQIPIDVEGRTYYGCCEMCKTRLATDAAVRSATDPVSGRSVDKAKAVIGRFHDGSVVYFESQANLRKYAAGGGR
jgi:YHS domain-containing protein